MNVADVLYESWLQMANGGNLRPGETNGGELEPTLAYEMKLTMLNPLRGHAIPKGTPSLDGSVYGGLEAYIRYETELLYGVCDWEVAMGKRPYTYHERIKRTEEKVLETLHKNPWSRRAVIPITTTEDYKSTEPPCVEVINLYMRPYNNDCGMVLDLYVTMRANECFKAAPHNLVGFARYHQLWAEKLGVPMGKYVHYSPCYYVQGSELDRFKAYVSLVSARQDDGAQELLGWTLKEYTDALPHVARQHEEECAKRRRRCEQTS